MDLIRPVLASRPAPLDADLSARVKTWVRSALDLGDDVAVVVSQLTCREPGCPPLETVLAVLQPGATRSVHLPLPAAQLTADDVQHAFARKESHDH